MLHMLKLAGQLKEVKPEVVVFLTRAKIVYRVDFECFPADGGPSHYVEAKGHPNALWPTKKKLWKHYGPGILHIYTGHYLKPQLTETIVPVVYT